MKWLCSVASSQGPEIAAVPERRAPGQGAFQGPLHEILRRRRIARQRAPVPQHLRQVFHDVELGQLIGHHRIYAAAAQSIPNVGRVFSG
jgi:hypothetical protein